MTAIEVAHELFQGSIFRDAFPRERWIVFYRYARQENYERPY